MTKIHPSEDPMNVAAVVLPDVPRIVIDSDGETPRYHESRADLAETALRAYLGLRGGCTLDLDHVRDLMQDLIHWIARHDPEGEPIYGAIASFEEAAQTAVRDFPRELAESQDE
jgi:hypothetical protein